MNSFSHDYTNEERLMFSYSLIRNYCGVIRGCSKRFDTFLELDISETLFKLVELRRAIIQGAATLYYDRLNDGFNRNKTAISKYDEQVEKQCKKREEGKDRDKDLSIDLDESIDGLKREDYMSKYIMNNNLNYTQEGFGGIYDFDPNIRSSTEKEAEA